MIRSAKRLLALLFKPVKPAYRTISKPIRKSRVFIFNNHQWMRGIMVILLVIMVGTLFVVQADEFAQQSREREKAINQQTLILCTLIIWENVDVADVAEVREVCEEEIERFSVEPNSNNDSGGQTNRSGGSDGSSDSGTRTYWGVQQQPSGQQSGGQPSSSSNGDSSGGSGSASETSSSPGEGNSEAEPSGDPDPEPHRDSDPNDRPPGLFRSQLLKETLECQVLQ